MRSGWTQPGRRADCLRVVETECTAQAFITTDLDDNQITAFHPGAMSHSHRQPGVRRCGGVSLGIVAPDGREGMLEHADAVVRRRHSVHLRSGPGPADVRRGRGGASRSCEQGDVGGGERLLRLSLLSERAGLGTRRPWPPRSRR
jgi:hypothetical protein